MEDLPDPGVSPRELLQDAAQQLLTEPAETAGGITAVSAIFVLFYAGLTYLTNIIVLKYVRAS